MCFNLFKFKQADNVIMFPRPVCYQIWAKAIPYLFYNDEYYATVLFKTVVLKLRKITLKNVKIKEDITEITSRGENC